MIFRLDLNQGIYVHFLRRGDNSTIKYWLLARRGLWEDVPEDGDKKKSQPSAWAEYAGRTKTTNLHHHQEGSSGVEEIAWSGGHVAGVWGNQGKVLGEHVADRRNFVGRWSTESDKTKIKLWSDSSGCKYFIDRRSFFGQRGAPGTFLRLFSPDGIMSTTQAISSTPLDPSWWWWKSVILVEICSCSRP